MSIAPPRPPLQYSAGKPVRPLAAGNRLINCSLGAILLLTENTLQFPAEWNGSGCFLGGRCGQQANGREGGRGVSFEKVVKVLLAFAKWVVVEFVVFLGSACKRLKNLILCPK